MGNMTPIRILIVDDHQLVRDGIKLLLTTFDDFEIVGLAEDGEAGVAAYHTLQPDVVLMDLVMPKLDGPSAIERIRDDDPDARVLVLTSFVEDEQVQRAIAAGATGYLLKNASPEQLAAAIHAAHAGRPTIDAEAAQALIRSSNQPQDRYELTPREREILALLVEGKTNKEIAQILFLSPATVRDYVSQILDKLDVKNRTEAATLALQKGILKQ